MKKHSAYTNLQFSLLFVSIAFLFYLALCPLAKHIHTPVVCITFTIIGVLSYYLYKKAQLAQHSFEAKLKFFDVFTIRAMLDSDLDEESKQVVTHFLDRHYPQWKNTNK